MANRALYRPVFVDSVILNEKYKENNATQNLNCLG